ncbi:MAG: P-loop NTPase [Halodesulfurarchaeum sp.]
MTEGNVYAVASGKGGVGKTTTAVNLGAAFVEAGRSVVVVDADLGMANLEDFLDVDPVAVTLHDVLAGDESIEEAIRAAPGDFDVVFGSQAIEDYGRADPANLREVIEDLGQRYDVVVLDGGGGLSHDVTVPLGIADGVLIVTTPADAAVTNAEKTIDLVERIGGSIEGLIVTRIGGAGRATPEVVSDRIDRPVLGAVPEDAAIQTSMDEGTPLVAIDRERPAAQSYREIAYGLLGEPLPRDWAGESEDSVGASGTDPAGDSPQPDSRGMGPADTAAPSPAGGSATESGEAATGGATGNAEVGDTPETGIAARLETMEGEAAGGQKGTGETGASEDPSGEPVGTAESEGDSEASPLPETGSEAPPAADEDDVDVIPGPAESTDGESRDSSDRGSFLGRLFGGLFG